MCECTYSGYFQILKRICIASGKCHFGYPKFEFTDIIKHIISNKDLYGNAYFGHKMVTRNNFERADAVRSRSEDNSGASAEFRRQKCRQVGIALPTRIE